MKRYLLAPLVASVLLVSACSSGTVEDSSTSSAPTASESVIETPGEATEDGTPAETGVEGTEDGEIVLSEGLQKVTAEEAAQYELPEDFVYRTLPDTALITYTLQRYLDPSQGDTVIVTVTKDTTTIKGTYTDGRPNIDDSFATPADAWKELQDGFLPVYLYGTGGPIFDPAECDTEIGGVSKIKIEDTKGSDEAGNDPVLVDFETYQCGSLTGYISDVQTWLQPLLEDYTPPAS